MKKIIALCLLVSMPVKVDAYDPPEPYETTQIINDNRIAMEDCLIILQEASETEADIESYDDLNLSLIEIESQMLAIQSEYDAINEQITELEWGESESLEWANIQLNFVVEEVYNDYWDNYETFPYMSEEEQLAIISDHEVVVAWRNYLNEIQQMINQLIADQSELEIYYSNLNYEYNYLVSQQDKQMDRNAQLNQCRLYAYTGDDLKIDQILLNNQLGLNDYLVQIDGYLSKLIPKAYRTVAFSDIQRIFKQSLADESLAEISPNKANIVLDSYAKEAYSYEKELSLVDIETMAHYAQRAYIKNGNLNDYHTAYMSVIDLKEAQWQYIYQSNYQVYDYIMDNLANYLNEKGHHSEESIDQLRALHLRYQVKLVLFDEQSMLWRPANLMESGYYLDYSLSQNPELLMADKSVWESFSIETEVLEEVSESIVTDSLDETNNHLESVKSQLSESRTPTDVKSLAKPSIDKLAQEQEEKKKDRDKKLSGITLPSTGEQRRFTLIAVIVLIIGILLLSINLWIKYRRKQEIDEIDLD